ncbi:hypothetical protein [[Actinomadura] parvosata]|nr:hypothetical protein [Nonomuraea sp. ATCC 55076]
MLDVSGVWGNVGAAVLGAVVALVVGGAVVALVDRGDAEVVTGLLRRGG